MARLIAIFVLCISMSLPAGAAPHAVRRNATATVCDLIEIAAIRRGLPKGFLARLIWQESGFRPQAISFKGAQGIAQFMPATASLRGVGNPFDPHEAILASAHLLSDLRARFGNLGLAAAAYNAGADRIAGWLAGERSLPAETRGYVFAITGYRAEHWSAVDLPADSVDLLHPDAITDCADIAAGRMAPAVAAAIAEAQWQPWGVQLAGGFSRDRAIGTFRRLQKKFPVLLGDHQPLVLRDKNLSRGTRSLVQVRIPVASRSDGDELCRRLREKGGACIVLRN